MGCRKTKKLLGPFMDGELPEEQRQKVADHLEGCASCRRRLESLDRLTALSRQLATAEPDETYWSTFLPRLRTRMARARKKSTRQTTRGAFGRLFAPPPPWVKIAGAVATAVLVLFLGRAVIHHEARMRRVRALPKKMLSEGVRVRSEKASPGRTTETELGEAPAEKPLQPGVPDDQDLSAPAEKRPVEAKVKPGAVSPPPSEVGFITIDQASRAEGRAAKEMEAAPPAQPPEAEEVPVDKGREFMALDRAGKKEKAFRGLATAGRAAGPDHWRRQIQIWEDSIKSQPLSDRLEEFHFQLAEGWYQLALLTTRREDLLRALEAQLTALDFTAEEATRELLRSRVQILEEHLRKK